MGTLQAGFMSPVEIPVMEAKTPPEAKRGRATDRVKEPERSGDSQPANRFRHPAELVVVEQTNWTAHQPVKVAGGLSSLKVELKSHAVDARRGLAS